MLVMQPWNRLFQRHPDAQDATLVPVSYCEPSFSLLCDTVAMGIMSIEGKAFFSLDKFQFMTSKNLTIQLVKCWQHYTHYAWIEISMQLDLFNLINYQ